MKIQFVNLSRFYKEHRSEINKAIQEVLKNTDFIMGEKISILEKRIAKFIGCKYAVAVGSGTDALYIALKSIGIEQGDEIITTPLTFIATSEAICRTGATPVFADIKSDTFNIDSNKIEELITSSTKAILPVHLYGQSANMNKIIKIAKKHNLKIVEDCAQSFGAEYRDKKTGSIGDVGAFSFFPAKVLGCYGDGGMITTNSEEIYNNAKIIRTHGYKKGEKNWSIMHGLNSRLDTIQASILLIKLKYIYSNIEMRNIKAGKYVELLSDIKEIKLPQVKSYNEHVWNYFTIRVKSMYRDKLMNFLKENGISCGVYYPHLIPFQPVFKNLVYTESSFPVASKIIKEILTLPLFPEIKDEEMEFISDKIHKFFIANR